MSRIIGIDLGTTNSCVAVMEGGKPTIIINAEGERTTPSVVAFTKDGDRLVGSAAKRQSVTNAERTVSSIKRWMGTDHRITIDRQRYTPQEISAMILSKLKADAESYLGEEVTEAVITVPAYFNDSQRKATQDAGRIAGLSVRRIINEPTSAALAYGLDTAMNQKVLVYDLGGGTFDVSIIEVDNGTISVLSTTGDTRLGGDDFDDRIVEFLVREFKASDQIDLSRDLAAMGRLKDEAEKAKKELSASMSSTISLPFIATGRDGPHHLEITLTRARFEELTGDLIERTIQPVQNAMSDAGLSTGDLDRVLLVGGSTRIPAVQEKVKQLLKQDPSKALNPDECVALGAAIQGGNLAGDVIIGAGNDQGKGTIVLLDVTPLSLSIETLGGVATTLIPRNSMIPTRQSQVFTTARAFQTSVEINVLQGERRFARDNKSLGKFRLDGIRRAMAGAPQIEVTFDIDVNGVVSVSAKDLATGNQQQITITASSNLSEAEIQQAIRNAQQYAQEDGHRKERLDICNDAEALCYRVDAALSNCKKELDRSEVSQIKNELSALKRLLHRAKPEKLDDRQVGEIKDCRALLEQDAGHLLSLYETQQQSQTAAGNGAI